MKLRAVVLSVLMVLSMATAGVSPAAAGAAGNASVSPSAVEFPETAVGDTATADVTITNDGAESVEVTGVEVTGRNDSQFTVTSGASGGTIASGESRTATVEYAPDDFHEHSATLNVSYADGTTSEVPLSEADTSLTLSGTVTDYVGGVDGATVEVVGTDTETTTAADGSYSLTVSEPSVDLLVTHTFPDGNSFTQTLSVELDGDTTRDVTHVPSLADLPGDGTADDPYEIRTVRELQAMEGDRDANYTLAADVNATGTDRWNGGAGFAPVGDRPVRGSDSDFTGSFDGDGYTVSNLTVNRSSESDVGLFGVVGSSGTVENVTLADVNVSSSNPVAGLVGFNNGGTVRASSVTGTVDASSFISDAGGLVGENRGTVSESSVTVNVSGDANVGGLVGENEGTVRESSATGDVDGIFNLGGLVGVNRGTVRESSATGDVNGTVEVGGLVGDNSFGNNLRDGGTVRESYATGNVSGESAVGGLAGANGGSDDGDGVVSESYATGRVSISGSSDDGEAGGGLIGANGGIVRRSYATGTVSATDSVENVGGLVGSGAFNFDGTVTDSYWDTESTGQDSSFGDGGTGLTTAQMTGGAAAVNMDGLTYYDTWALVDGEYPELARNVDRSAGTEADPFAVSNAGELQAIEDNLSASYVLTGDIDASATSGWDDGAGFDPIGDDEPFSGTFDGEGHTVSNLTIDRPSGLDVGLFGTVSDGTVRNIALEEAAVNGSSETGALAGRIEPAPTGGETTVTAVTVTESTVDGRDSTGGVAGEVGSTTLTNASVSGVTVSSDGLDVGGLVGRNTGTVEESTAEATVEGAARVGGAVGENSGTVAFVTANGSVEGDFSVGGLVGDNVNTVEQTYAAAVVSGDSDTGGLVGTDRGTVSASYWDTTVSGQSDSTSATGLTTAEMTGVSAASNMTAFDFGNEWALTEGYPVLAERYDGEPPAPFVVTITDTNAPVLTGETLTVDATVENVGDAAETDRLTLLGVGGSEVDSTDVTLLADGTTDVTLTWTPSTPQSGDVTVTGLVTNGTTPVSVETSEAVFDATITDANDTVTDGETVAVEYEVTNDGASGAEETIQFTADGQQVGSETVTLLDGESTTGTFTYTSTASDAPSLTAGVETGDDTATRAVSVNRIPTARNDSDTVLENGTLSVGATAGLLTDDTDPDGDDLTVTTTPVAGPSNGTVALDADGSFEYTPEDGFVGEDSFTYEVADGNGGTDTATVTVTVTEPPEPANFTVEITGTNAPVTAGETLSVTAAVTNVGETAGTQTVTLEAFDSTGVDSQSVGPDPGNETSVTLEWATGDTDDGSGPLTVRTDNDTATRSVTVETADDGGSSGGGGGDDDDNDGGGGGGSDDDDSGGGDDDDGGGGAVPTDSPEATDDTYTVAANGTLAVGAADGVLANDDEVRSAAVESEPENGTLTLAGNGSFTYTPSEGFTGTDSFTYGAADGSATATVTVTVIPSVSDPTVIENASAIRQRVDVPANATPAVAERVRIADDGPSTANFTANTTVTSVEFGTNASGNLTVVEYEEPPSTYDDVPGSTVVAMRIDGGPAVENASATVRTRVSRSEFGDTDASALRIAHRVDGNWELLNTTVASQDGDAVVLAATPDDLSPFAVTAVAQSGTPATPTPTPAPQTDTATPTATTTLVDGTTTSADGPGFGVGAALAAIAAVAIVVLRRRR